MTDAEHTRQSEYALGNVPPAGPFERFEPDPLWTPTNVTKPCKCGWYKQEDGSTLKWYCSMEHYLDD